MTILAGIAAVKGVFMRDDRRIARERRTVRVMAGMYCRDRHGTQKGALCADCDAIYAYAMERIDKCPFIGDKPTCLKCPVHCYKAEKREQIRQIMRYSGPRMIFSHPILAVLHLVDGGRAKSKAKALKQG